MTKIYLNINPLYILPLILNFSKMGSSNQTWTSSTDNAQTQKFQTNANSFEFQEFSRNGLSSWSEKTTTRAPKFSPSSRQHVYQTDGFPNDNRNRTQFVRDDNFPANMNTSELDNYGFMTPQQMTSNTGSFLDMYDFQNLNMPTSLTETLHSLSQQKNSEVPSVDKFSDSIENQHFSQGLSYMCNSQSQGQQQSGMKTKQPLPFGGNKLRADFGNNDSGFIGNTQIDEENQRSRDALFQLKFDQTDPKCGYFRDQDGINNPNILSGDMSHLQLSQGHVDRHASVMQPIKVLTGIHTSTTSSSHGSQTMSGPGTPNSLNESSFHNYDKLTSTPSGNISMNNNNSPHQNLRMQFPKQQPFPVNYSPVASHTSERQLTKNNCANISEAFRQKMARMTMPNQNTPSQYESKTGHDLLQDPNAVQNTAFNVEVPFTEMLQSPYARERQHERLNQGDKFSLDLATLSQLHQPFLKLTPNFIAPQFITTTPHSAFPTAEAFEYLPIDPYGRLAPAYLGPEMFFDIPPYFYHHGVHPFIPGFRNPR